jgi:1-deoxy-D-xylulose 5-phosphate reductoisomerase
MRLARTQRNGQFFLAEIATIGAANEAAIRAFMRQRIAAHMANYRLAANLYQKYRWHHAQCNMTRQYDTATRQGNLTRSTDGG